MALAGNIGFDYDEELHKLLENANPSEPESEAAQAIA